ncbi:spermatogenesis-associated protein 16 isoform X1 [Rhinatrema bivittatum]|uniref:spermatogenesis-associated protein 16 isoform X1 n=1 Tax=Rhinatrema bivittatum TaxID=194408 RepID=UPI001129C68E|nr:spermatogenesis-associated protein 16 isoform X1 [Rhinatrema bivittatum]
MDWELPTEDFFIQHGDRDCLKAMDSAGDKDFESTVNEKCQRETSQKANSSGGVKNIIEEKQLSIPDMLRNVKTSADAQMEENGPERIKATRGLKEKQQTHDPLRAGLKRKSEHEEKLMAKKDPRLLEIENQLVSLPLPRIPLKSVMDVEVKLVFVDEQDISYEFIDSLVSTSTQSTCRAVEIVDSLSAPNFSFLPQIDKWLQVALKDASTCYRQKKYAIAAGRFRTALELCSKGAALGKPFDTSAEDISSVASFIETKLACCYLRMRRPDLALNHAHRSITLNPTHFRNHLRQATVFRSLERYPEAARSAMIADYMYWMSGGSEQHISKLIKLYWQAMIEEAITRAESFSVMYTPFAKKLRAEKTEKVKEIFTKKHPAYAEYIYSDSQVVHILPQTIDWSSGTPQQYLLILGFKSKDDGNFLEKISNRKLPTFIEHKTLFRPFTKEEAERHLERLGKRVLPILDFIRCTKLPGSFSACSGVIEKLQYASFLSQSQRGKEESQVINQAMAELATIPYLQDISQQDAELLQSLMADAMDSLEEKRSNKERVWNKIQKVGLIEDYLYQLEDSFLKTKKLRTARRQRMKMKRLQSVHLCQSQENSQPSPRHPEGGSKDINTVEI